MDYAYGYCGMPCALCSRYRSEGKSRCPGCSAGGYYTEGCKAYRCCREKGLRHCGCCVEYPCVRLGRMADFRDLNTGNVKPRSCRAIAEGGFDAWYEEYAARAALLTEALTRYNDGRMKRFLCELFIQRDMDTLKEIMRRAESLCGTPKENARAFRQIAQEAAQEDAITEEKHGV